MSPSKRAILALLRDQPEAVPQHAIEQHTGLHGNTIREHLVGLIELGFIRRFPAEAVGRGRPSWLYEMVVDPEKNNHVQQATALSDTICASSADPIGDAIRSGEHWGSTLIRGIGEPTDTNHDRVLTLFEKLGFEPALDTEDPELTRLHHCPLLGAATRTPGVACSVHLGIARGAVAELGGDPARCELHQFAEPGACTMTW
jgi:predicted ArsR family transcriptional regulator